MRVAALIGAALLACAAPAAAQVAAVPPVVAGERVLGRADAPVTVIEYASFTCPHCADWSLNVLPTFKARWIDTGKVRLVYRDLPTAPAELAVPAALISRCSAPDKAFGVIEGFFEGQEAAHLSGWPETWLEQGAARTGRPRAETLACVRDPSTMAALEADIDGARSAGVRGTPTFFVNGVRVADTTLEGLAAVIDPLLAGR